MSLTKADARQIIRAASVSIDVLEDLVSVDSLNGLFTIIQKNPFLMKELQAYHPEILKKSQQIMEATECRPKVIRKTSRALSGIILRAASRCTPSRLLASIGSMRQTTPSAMHGVVLADNGFISVSRQRIPESEAQSWEDDLRWNPSVIIWEQRCYVTAPRKTATASFSSVGFNRLLELIKQVTQDPINKSFLIKAIQSKYVLTEKAVIENVIQELINHEILLSGREMSYEAYRKMRQVGSLTVSFCNNSVELLNDAKLINHDIDLYRDATGNLPDSMCDDLREYVEHCLKHHVFELADAGLTKNFAQLLLEKYGAARVPIQHVLHPIFGIDWRSLKNSAAELRDRQSQKTSDYLRAVYNLGVQHAKRWVDIKTCGSLPVEEGSYLNFDSSDLIASVHGSFDQPIYNVADAISSVHAGTTTGRFDHLCDFSTVTDSISIDWMSPEQSFNSVREFATGFERVLNINSSKKHANELTFESLQVWSDGTSVRICDEDGEPIKIRPTSMAGVGAYPDWVAQLILAANASAPNINWSWGSLAEHVDYLPGVRFGNIIVSRPAFRYTGPVDFTHFNEWADCYSISGWIRIGDADRKIMLKRNNAGFAEQLEFQLRRTDGWIYETFPEERTTFVQDSFGKPVFSEVVTTFNVVSDIPDFHIARGRAKDLPVVKPLPEREIIPTASEHVNLVITPRSGLYEKTLQRIFALPELNHQEIYFIRYPNEKGESAIRLRYKRHTGTEHRIGQLIKDLTFNGTLLQVEEKTHSLEYERYGGEKVFPLFEKFFAYESLLAASLGNTHEDKPVSDEMHLPLLMWWLSFFPSAYREVIDFATSEVATPEIKKAASALIRGVDHHGDLSALVPVAAQQLTAPLADIAQEIAAASVNAYTIQSAAHLFCNRLGVSTDKEKVLWRSIKKLEGVKKNDNFT